MDGTVTATLLGHWQEFAFYAGVLWIALVLVVAWPIRSWLAKRPARRWAPLLAATFAVAAPVSIWQQFNAPLTGAYNPGLAQYWIARAAAAPTKAEKETHLRRVAISSPEYGWFIATRAIDHVADPKERCQLRTILAAQPELEKRDQLREEARRECAA